MSNFYRARLIGSQDLNYQKNKKKFAYHKKHTKNVILKIGAIYLHLIVLPKSQLRNSKKKKTKIQSESKYVEELKAQILEKEWMIIYIT